jgi:DNA-binding NarL/FixJ family response regulator
MTVPYFILIVEDNESHAEALKRTIERLIPDVRVAIYARNFAGALDEYHTARPDIFIVDLYEGDYAPETLKGPEVCKQIWNRRFRPLIVHSAFDADPHIEDRLARHPFYRYIAKGSPDCADQVAKQVNEFLSHAAALREVEDEVHAVLQTVIQDTAEAIWLSQTEPIARTKAIIRSARRRVGAQMDLKPLLSNDTVLPWEQYIVPPLEADLLMGDVLKVKGSSPGDASSYRVVLTPSCDLVLRKRKAKVSAALVGKCVDAKTFFNALRLGKSGSRTDLQESLETILTQPQVNGYCPLPAYPNLWPNMAIKLRDTDFVGFDDIFGDKQKFQRVASIDSPFREQIAWAHMQIASRPALPDRELKSWIEGILAAAEIR